MDFPIPAYYYFAELDERFDFLFELLHDIYDDLDDLKAVLGLDESPKSSFDFDPFQTAVDPFDPLLRITCN